MLDRKKDAIVKKVTFGLNANRESVRLEWVDGKIRIMNGKDEIKPVELLKFKKYDLYPTSVKDHASGRDSAMMKKPNSLISSQKSMPWQIVSSVRKFMDRSKKNSQGWKMLHISRSGTCLTRMIRLNVAKSTKTENALILTVLLQKSKLRRRLSLGSIPGTTWFRGGVRFSQKIRKNPEIFISWLSLIYSGMFVDN